MTNSWKEYRLFVGEKLGSVEKELKEQRKGIVELDKKVDLI